MPEWIRPALWMVGFVAVLLAAVWLLQRRLIYFPTADVPPIDRVLPGWTAGTAATEDGLELNLWYRPPPADAPVVIVFTGNAGNRSHRAQLGERLADEGLGVVLLDYRGYGDNPGRPTEEGLALDARAAVAFVRTEAAGHPIVIFGESLGAAVAIELALTDPPAGLVLRSPFLSLPGIAAVHYPWLPTSALLRDRFPSDERIGHVEAPVLMVAGSADSIVPTEQSRALYELAREPKEMVIIEGAGHNDFALLAGDELIEAVTRFITGLSSG